MVELLVVIAVITIITAVVLFSQNQFDSSTLLRSLSYSIALSVRQAQTYGTSVRYSGGSPVGDFSQSYGIYYDYGDLSLSPPRYFLFQDYNGNGAYDAGEGLPAYILPRGYIISKVCGITPSGQDCWLYGGSGALTYVTIYFQRPNPDACIETSLHPSDCAPGSSAQDYSAAYLQVKPSGTAPCKSDGGTQDCRAVKVSTTGQITVCELNAVPGGTIPC